MDAANNPSRHSKVYTLVAEKILQWISVNYSKALQATPLERPGLTGGIVRNPVCELIEAEWLGVSRLIPQFCDGLAINLDSPPIPRISEIDLLPGDVLICCPEGEGVQGTNLNPDKISESVRIFTRGIFTHAAIVGRNNIVYEAALPAVQATPFNSWIREFRYVVVLRHGNAAEKMARDRLFEYIESQVGARYNAARAIRIMLVGQVSRRTWQSRTLETAITILESTFFRKCHVCSTFVWSALVKAGVATSGSSIGEYVTPSAFIDQALLMPIGYATSKHFFVPHRLDSYAGSYVK